MMVGKALNVVQIVMLFEKNILFLIFQSFWENCWKMHPNFVLLGVFKRNNFPNDNQPNLSEIPLQGITTIFVCLLVYYTFHNKVTTNTNFFSILSQSFSVIPNRVEFRYFPSRKYYLCVCFSTSLFLCSVHKIWPQILMQFFSAWIINTCNHYQVWLNNCLQHRKVCLQVGHLVLPVRISRRPLSQPLLLRIFMRKTSS